MRRTLLRSFALVFPLAVAVATGCSALDPVTGDPSSSAPGARSVATGDPTCRADSECAAGEQCTDGVCQMQRCVAPDYASTAPMGRRRTFATDREILVVSDDASRRSIDGYEPTDGSFAFSEGASFAFQGARIVDAAGGNLTGSRAEAVAVALENAPRIAIVSGQTREDLQVGFVPVAVAAGDVDGDGVDEVVALAANGALSICKATTKTCETRSIAGVLGKDLVVADVDGDGFAEPVALVDAGGKSTLVVVNMDAATTNQAAEIRTTTDKALVRLSAGLFAGNTAATVVALEEGGYADFAADALHFFANRDAKLTAVSTTNIAKDAVDVLVADADGDDQPEILVLEKSGVETYRATETGAAVGGKTQLTASRNPTRLLAADVDGDSPIGVLTKDAPDLVPGPVVPVSVFVYPPYSRTWSYGTSVIWLGSGESKADEIANTVSLRANATVGFSAGIAGVAKASISATVDRGWSTTNANSRSISVGDAFFVEAKPEIEGPDNGVAVLACACFHAYTYKVEDPKGRLGGGPIDGRLMSVFVPVGGQTTLWSVKRYNAMAAKVGTLPTIRAPYIVGDVDSYPKTLSRLDGSPVPPADMLFTTPRTYRTSDVSRVGWTLEVREGSSRTEAESTDVFLNGSLNVGPVFAEGSVGRGTAEAYTVSVGKSATFGGWVPPIRNDVKTPEDEHELHGYGFAPIVYRDRYKTAQGVEGGYYVVTYTVSK